MGVDGWPKFLKTEARFGWKVRTAGRGNTQKTRTVRAGHDYHQRVTWMRKDGPTLGNRSHVSTDGHE